MLRNTERPNAKKIIEKLNTLIEMAKSNNYEKHLFKHDVKELTILREAIEKHANGEVVDFNEMLDIPAINQVYRATDTYLKIATSKCDASVADYLFQNGAKATEGLIFYPVQYQNLDLQNVLKVLKDNDVNINPTCNLWNDNYSLYFPVKHGHTLLFWAERKNHKDLASALTNNGAELTIMDKLSLPGSKFKDTAEKVLDTIIMPAPR